MQRRLFRKQVWLPWTRSTVWDALVQPDTLACCAGFHACRHEQDRPLEQGDMLLWQRETLLFRHGRFLLVEHLACHGAIRLRMQADGCERTITILLEPEEGGEVTRIEVSVEVTFPHARFRSWFLLLFLAPTINRSVMRALQRFDTLLENRQAQAEQGANMVYLYWRRMHQEREWLQRQLITDIWRLRYE